MDNELDGRLRRLETVLEAQRDMLDAQAAQQGQIHTLLKALVSVVMKPEPDGPPLHELLAQLIQVVGRNNALAKQNHATSDRILVAVERRAPDGRPAA